MQHLTHIVFAVAGQPMYGEALRWAAALAADAGADLTVLEVFPPIPTWRRHLEVDGHDVDLQPLLVDDVSDAWKAGVARVLGDGHTARVEAITGHPVRATIEHVERLGADLIVRGELPAPTAVDPITSRLLRAAPVPVLVARPRPGGTGPVLVAVDVEGSDGDDALNRRVLEVGAALARSHGAPLHVVHAWDQHEEPILRSSSFLRMSSDAVDHLLARTEQHHRDALSALVGGADLQGLRATEHVHRGDASEIIAATARATGAEVVVAGTVGRRGLSRVVLGNTAEGLLRTLDVSLLAVKPSED